MQAFAEKEDPTEQSELNNQHLYEKLTLAGFHSARCNDDLLEKSVESSGWAEDNATQEAQQSAVAYGVPTRDRAQPSPPTTSLQCYKFTGFEYMGSFPMNVKEVEEAVLDCLKSQVFPTMLRKEGRKVILLADSGTVLVQPALDGSYSNDILATLLLRRLICFAPDSSTGQDLFAMVVKGSTMKAVTAHVFRAANSEKVSELCKRVELLWRGAKQQLDSTATIVQIVVPTRSKTLYLVENNTFGSTLKVFFACQRAKSLWWLLYLRGRSCQ